MSEKIKQYREYKKKFFVFSIFIGAYPPGTEAYLNSTILSWVFYLIALFIGVAVIINGSGVLYYMLFYPVPNKLILIQLFRRMLVVYYIGGRILMHVYRSTKNKNLFEMWEESFNVTYIQKARNECLTKVINSSTKIASIGISLRYSMACMYNIPFIFDRYTRSSELCGWPHDNNSPYHFVYVAFQVIVFVWGGLTLLTIELGSIYLLCLAQAELIIMKEKLQLVLNQLTIKNNELIYNSENGTIPIEYGELRYNEVSNNVNDDLRLWASKHVALLEWINEMGDYLRPEVIWKYIYLSIHCSLVVIGLTNMTGANMLNDLVLTLMVTVGNFWVLFYGSRKIDDIAKKCNDIALDGYGEAWAVYPVKVQKTLQLIMWGAINNEFQITFFKIYKDNSESIMDVLQMAYNVLTFILPMTDKD